MDIRDATTRAERERCYAIRIAVFVDEQRVPLDEEIDAHDETDARHVLLFDDGVAVGTGRLIPQGRTAKIGRFAVLRKARGLGYGDAIVRHFVDVARDGFDEAVLDAQLYVIPFYERFGFVAEGPEFDDAGIAHRKMRLTF